MPNGLAQYGVIKDISQGEIPENAWTDANNFRFYDGSARQFLGHRSVYPTVQAVPQYVVPVLIGGAKYWIYMAAAKAYAVSFAAGVYTHTDITHVTPHAGVVNQWTGCLLSGVPILNVGDTSKVPMAWDLNLGNNFIDLTNWPAATYCKSIRAYKNMLIALNITKGATNYPFMIKWSHPADPGALPSSWDETSATKEAGERDIAEGGDVVVDGGQLTDSFIVYKEASTWRLDFIGGVNVFRQVKVLGTDGIMNRNCWVEHNGMHFVLTGSDVMVHDGQSGQSILDKRTRRFLFSQIDGTYQNLCFVAKNPFFNEVWFCYPEVGQSVCNRAMVYNTVDKTVSFRSLPNLNHMSDGGMDPTAAGDIESDAEPIDSDFSLMDQLELVPALKTCLGGSSDGSLYAFDVTAYYAGTLPDAYLERVGLTFGNPNIRKFIRGIRARIVGTPGDVVTIKVGTQENLDDTPTWVETSTHTIGDTIQDDFMVDGGYYVAVRFESSGINQWRIDSYDFDFEEMGAW